MYYRDQYGNVVEYSPEGLGEYSNSIHPGGVGYHPLTRENFEFSDITGWFQKNKNPILYTSAIIVIIMLFMWWHNKKTKSSTSIFY